MSGSSPAERWGLTAAFLDRDGTINAAAPEGDYIESVAELRLLPGAATAVRRLSDAGLRVVIVTNQRGIALGRMTEEDLTAIHARMLEQLEAEGARVEAVYHCPHDEGECDCRKPGPGMLDRARREVPGIELARSVTIGDSERDMGAGRAAGTRLIRVGAQPDVGADMTAPSLQAAVAWLLRPTP